MIKSAVVIIMTTFLVVGCQTVEHHCPNETSLLNALDIVPSISLDFTRNTAELESKIRSITSAQDQKKPLHFGLLINGIRYNSSIHAAHIVDPVCYGMPAMQHRSPQLEVNLNFPDKALMEGKNLIRLDSIPGYIAWYFPNDKPYGEKIVKLTFKPDSEAEAIKKTIEQIAKGYLKFYEKESKQKFQKPLCELDSTELKAVSKKYPFELRLWVGDPPKSYTPVLSTRREITTS